MRQLVFGRHHQICHLFGVGGCFVRGQGGGGWGAGGPGAVGDGGGRRGGRPHQLIQMVDDRAVTFHALLERCVSLHVVLWLLLSAAVEVLCALLFVPRLRHGETQLRHAAVRAAHRQLPADGTHVHVLAWTTGG